MVVVSWASWDTIVSRDSAGAPVAIAARTDDGFEIGEKIAFQRSKVVSSDNAEC